MCTKLRMKLRVVLSGFQWMIPNVEPELNAVSGDKCQKCGSKKRRSDACTVDLAKVKCFSCGGSGHIGANCPLKPKGGSVNQGDKWSKGKCCFQFTDMLLFKLGRVVGLKRNPTDRSFVSASFAWYLAVQLLTGANQQ